MGYDENGSTVAPVKTGANCCKVYKSNIIAGLRLRRQNYSGKQC